MPTVDQAKAVTELLRERSKVPDYVFKVRGHTGHTRRICTEMLQLHGAADHGSFSLCAPGGLQLAAMVSWPRLKLLALQLCSMACCVLLTLSSLLTPPLPSSAGAA